MNQYIGAGSRSLAKARHESAFRTETHKIMAMCFGYLDLVYFYFISRFLSFDFLCVKKIEEARSGVWCLIV